MYSSFDDMVLKQRVALAAQKAAERDARNAAFAASLVGAIPARVRLMSLLSVAYDHECRSKCGVAPSRGLPTGRSLIVDELDTAAPAAAAAPAVDATMSTSSDDDEITQALIRGEDVKAAEAALAKKKAEKRRAVTGAAYTALANDVALRLRNLGVRTKEEMHQVSSEAIACFASMLPWSDGIVQRAKQAPLAKHPEAAGILRHSTAGGYRPKPFQRAPAAAVSAVAASLQPQSDDEWEFPSKLSFDPKKVHDNMAKRRERLVQLALAVCA